MRPTTDYGRMLNESRHDVIVLHFVDADTGSAVDIEPDEVVDVVRTTITHGEPNYDEDCYTVGRRYVTTYYVKAVTA